jgi:hypothetical protein
LNVVPPTAPPPRVEFPISVVISFPGSYTFSRS